MKIPKTGIIHLNSYQFHMIYASFQFSVLSPYKQEPKEGKKNHSHGTNIGQLAVIGSLAWTEGQTKNVFAKLKILLQFNESRVGKFDLRVYILNQCSNKNRFVFNEIFTGFYSIESECIRRKKHTTNRQPKLKNRLFLCAKWMNKRTEQMQTQTIKIIQFKRGKWRKWDRDGYEQKIAYMSNVTNVLLHQTNMPNNCIPTQFTFYSNLSI